MIADSVSALGVMIAFYYGLTGFSCAWYYRKTLTAERRGTCGCGASCPSLGGLILWVCMLWYNLWYYWKPVNSYTTWTLPFWPHWHMGGVFLLDVVALVLGIGPDVRLRAPSARRSSAARCSTATRRPWSPKTSACRSGLFGIDPEPD